MPGAEGPSSVHVALHRFIEYFCLWPNAPSNVVSWNCQTLLVVEPKLNSGISGQGNLLVLQL